MVWSWSGQKSVWSEKSGHRRIRAHLSLIRNSSSAIGSDRKRIGVHFSLIINGSSAIGSDQKCFRTQLGLIRDHFDRLNFFSPIALIRERSPADIKGQSPSEEILINWRPRFFLWKAVETHPSSQKYTLNGTLKKIVLKSWVLFSSAILL